MSSLQERRADFVTTIWTGTVTASSDASLAGNSTATAQVMPTPNAIAFTLSAITSASSTNGTLDLAVQTRLRGTSDYVDVLAFTQLASSDGSTAGTPQFVYGKMCAGSTQAMFVPGTSLAAGSVRHMIGDEWRCRWLNTSPSSVVSWAVVLTALPM